MVCTPLFLNAEPQTTGKIFIARVALRMPARISSSVSATPLMNFSNRRSSNSETASTSLSRYSLAFSKNSAGISTMSNSAPSVSSRQITAFIVTRSTTPLNWSSAPTGI
jgi:hypothetical protein